MKYKSQIIIVTEADNADAAFETAKSIIADLTLTDGIHTAFLVDDPEEYVDDVEYAAFVFRFGLGFHPDIFGGDYSSLPDGMTPEYVDRMNELARENGVLVYEVALECFHALFRVVDQWKHMYAEWEHGHMASPSFSDLVAAAGRLTGAVFEESAVDAAYAVFENSGELYEVAQTLLAHTPIAP